MSSKRVGATGRAVGRPPSTKRMESATSLPIPPNLSTSDNTKPQPPDHLNDEGVALWNSVYSACSWLTPADAWEVEIFVDSVLEYRLIRATLSANGGRIYRMPNGTMVSNPLVAQRRDTMLSIASSGSAIGLSPASRARLLIEASETTSSIFAKDVKTLTAWRESNE